MAHICSISNKPLRHKTQPLWWFPSSNFNYWVSNDKIETWMKLGWNLLLSIHFIQPTREFPLVSRLTSKLFDAFVYLPSFNSSYFTCLPRPKQVSNQCRKHVFTNPGKIWHLAINLTQRSALRQESEVWHEPAFHHFLPGWEEAAARPSALFELEVSAESPSHRGVCSCAGSSVSSLRESLWLRRSRWKHKLWSHPAFFMCVCVVFKWKRLLSFDEHQLGTISLVLVLILVLLVIKPVRQSCRSVTNGWPLNQMGLCVTVREEWQHIYWQRSRWMISDLQCLLLLLLCWNSILTWHDATL